MKVQINAIEIEGQFENYKPIIIEHIKSGAIVFLGCNNEFKEGKFTNGNVLKGGDTILSLGAYLSGWRLEEFRLFNGTITLSND